MHQSGRIGRLITCEQVPGQSFAIIIPSCGKCRCLSSRYFRPRSGVEDQARNAGLYRPPYFTCNCSLAAGAVNPLTLSTMSTITPQVLLKAYTAGIFPMAESANDSALYWVEPEVRGIIPLDRFHISRSLARRIRSRQFSVTVDTDFDGIIRACSGQAGSAGENPVIDRPSTWINSRISALYNQLYAMGFCHSVECRDAAGNLVGGLYGVRIAAAFFGESMFSANRDASKVAMVHLVARLNAGGFHLLDTQFATDHLKTFGCLEIPRDNYRRLLDDALLAQANFAEFKDDDNPDAVLTFAKSGHHEDT